MRRSLRVSRVAARSLFSLAIVVVLLLGPIFVGPALWRAADRAGLPGGLFALVLVVAGPSVALLHLYREWPQARRAHAMRRFARGSGLVYVARFKLPASVTDLPALGGADDLVFDGTVAGGYSNLLSGRRGDNHVMVFDYWTEAESSSPYSKPQWETCIATTTGLECPQLIVQPRLSRVPRGGSGLPDVRFESASFHTQFRVLCGDPKFASALMDARLIAWFLATPWPWTLEIGGGWAAITSSELAPERIEPAIEALAQFHAHMPRVMRSLYPPPGPHFA